MEAVIGVCLSNTEEASGPFAFGTSVLSKQHILDQQIRQFHVSNGSRSVLLPKVSLFFLAMFPDLKLKIDPSNLEIKKIKHFLNQADTYCTQHIFFLM